MPESESDALPLQSDQMGYAFCDMAARIFTFLWTTQPVDGIKNDAIYNGAKSALMALNNKKDHINSYGYHYG